MTIIAMLITGLLVRMPYLFLDPVEVFTGSHKLLSGYPSSQYLHIFCFGHADYQVLCDFRAVCTPLSEKHQRPALSQLGRAQGVRPHDTVLAHQHGDDQPWHGNHSSILGQLRNHGGCLYFYAVVQSVCLLGQKGSVPALRNTHGGEVGDSTRNNHGGSQGDSTSKWAKLRTATKAGSKTQASHRRGLVETGFDIFSVLLFPFIHSLIIAFYTVGKQGNDSVSMFILNIGIQTSVVVVVYSMFRIAEGSEVGKFSLGRLLQSCCGRCCIRCCTSRFIVVAFGGDADFGKHGLNAYALKEAESDVPRDEGGEVEVVSMDHKNKMLEQKRIRETAGGDNTWSAKSAPNAVHVENSDGFIDPETGQRYWVTADGRTSWTDPRQTVIDTADPSI